MGSREVVARAGWSIRRSVAVVPTDLFLVALYAAGVAGLIVGGVVDGPLRVAIGLPLVLLAPGYAFVMALFPAASHAEAVAPSASRRVVLAFGTSVALLPIVGVAYAASPLAFEAEPVVGTVAGVTILFATLGAVRRWRLPAEARFHPDIRGRYVRLRAWLLADEPLDRVLNGALAVSIVIAVLSVGFALAAPPDADPHTELYIATDADGETVAADYPIELDENESAVVRVGVENREGETHEYTLVVQLQTVVDDGDEVRVTDRDELDTESIILEDEDTWEEDVTVDPTRTGENLRVVFLLYQGDAPDEPTVDDAYRHVHFWTDVGPTEAPVNETADPETNETG